MRAPILDCISDLIDAPSAEVAGKRYFAAMERIGATYLQARVYRRPTARLTSQGHHAAGGVVFRHAPASWGLGSDAYNYVCLELNPLLQPIRESWTRYRFSDFAPLKGRSFGEYWDAIGEARIGDALCATAYGAGGKIASIHLGFADSRIDERDADLAQTAGLVLTEKLMNLCEPPETQNAPTLTTRERDAIALVADGKTDWEVSVILSVSEATARFHVDNARKKLGAVNRAQAVAKLFVQRMI